MSEIDQKERADAYYRNMVAMIFGARCEYRAHADVHGHDGIDAAQLRDRLRVLVSTVEEIECGKYHDVCDACGKPLLDGQQCIYYCEDAVTTHADCSDPQRVIAAPQSSPYDSMYSPEECAAEIAKAKAVLAEADGEG